MVPKEDIHSSVPYCILIVGCERKRLVWIPDFFWVLLLDVKIYLLFDSMFADKTSKSSCGKPHKVYCPWHNQSWSAGVPQSWPAVLGVPHRQDLWQDWRTPGRTCNETGVPPPRKGPGTRDQGRNLRPEAIGYPSPSPKGHRTRGWEGTWD